MYSTTVHRCSDMVKKIWGFQAMVDSRKWRAVQQLSLSRKILKYEQNYRQQWVSDKQNCSASLAFALRLPPFQSEFTPNPKNIE